jgi:hypothetical protein
MTETTPGQAARSELLKLLGELWRNSPVERSALDDILRAADAYAAAAPAEPQPAPELAAAMAALEDIARAAQDHADSTGAIDHNWLVETALRGLGRMPASEDEQAEGDDVRPRADGQRGLDITCGACGEDYGTNVTDLDEIECVECEARRCPHCQRWFGGQS